MNSAAKLVVLWALALLVFLFLGAANVYLGDLNQDEGWYLYAGKQVAEGHVPYRDFVFTQGPVMPSVYALSVPLLRRWGLVGGRVFTVGLGLALALLAACLAGRLVRKELRGAASVLAFILLGTNVYQSYFTTIVKTYALCGVFLVAGMLALSFVGGRRGMIAAAVAGVLLALAAGVRISAGAALPVAGLYLLMRKGGLAERRWLAFGIGGGAALLLLFVPFMVLAPEGFMFGMVEYHANRSAGSVVTTLAYKAGFVSRFVQAYFVPTLCLLALVVLGWFRPGEKDTESLPPSPAPAGFRGLLWAVGLAVTFVHFVAPFPYDDYQVFVVPLFVAALSGALVARLGLGRRSDGTVGFTEPVAPSRKQPDWVFRVVLLVYLASTAASFSSPLNQDWFIAGRDRIWWRLKEESSVAKLRRVGRLIREQTNPGDELFTQDTYIAIEANRPVPRGMELGAFSYFPELSTERAEEVHVLNRERLIHLMRTMEAPLAAISGYGLAIASPAVQELPEADSRELWDVLLERYEPVEEVPQFGQAHTTLRILRREPGAADEE